MSQNRNSALRRASRRGFLKKAGATAVMSPLALGATGLGFASAKDAVSGDITMIKGPHSADEARFEAMIIDDFKMVEPDVDVTFTTYDWGNMNAELTTGFASGNRRMCCTSST